MLHWIKCHLFNKHAPVVLPEKGNTDITCAYCKKFLGKEGERKKGKIFHY